MDVKELTRARNTAYRLLTYRSRSCAEVERKLREKGFDDCITHAVLDEFIRLGYLDDEKFVVQWAECRVRLSSHGKHRIELELIRKGVGREVVRRKLAEVFSADTEITTARQAAFRRLQSMQSLDHSARHRRIAGYLERKGYSYEVIRSILRDIDKGAGFESE